MGIYSYIVVHDNGFSPNPFHGLCTLACCKPRIRNAAKAGDWVIGLSPKRDGHHLVYAMQVAEVVSFATYWQDSRYRAKQANFTTLKDSLGDNIYEPLGGGKFRQHRSWHSTVNPAIPKTDYQRFTDQERKDAKRHDLSGKNVLVAHDFVYYGSEKTAELPPEWRETLKVGRGHRTIPDGDTTAAWEKYISGRLNGMVNKPPDTSQACLCSDAAPRTPHSCDGCPTQG